MSVVIFNVCDFYVICIFKLDKNNNHNNLIQKCKNV